MTSTLLIRPKPFQGESFYSWLSRVATENVSRNKRRILELADLLGTNKRIKSYPAFSEKRLKALSELTGIECSRILTTLWSEFKDDCKSSELSGQFLFSGRAKICPLCVAENKYWLKVWQLQAVTTCPKHGIRLTTTCKCGKPVELYPASVLYCECGRQLSKQKLVDATHAELNLTNYVLRYFNGKADQAFQDSLSEIQFCLWYWYQAVRGHDDQLIRSWSYRRVVSGCKYVGSLVEDTEFNISPLMSRFVRSVGQSQLGFRVVMGNCHDYMKRLVANGYTGELANQLADFEELGWHGAKLLRRARYGDASLLITAAELALDHQCKKVKVKRLIEYGDIDIVAKGRRVDLVDATNDAFLAEKMAAWLSLKEAAQLLNISKDWVLQLVESMLIEGRKERNQRDWLISKNSCDSLILQLKARSVSNAHCLVALKSLQIFPGQYFSEIIRKCLDGKLCYRISNSTSHLNRIKVERRYIHALGLREKGELLSAKEVGGYLTINLNAVYYLVCKKYIEVSSRYCRSRRVYGFSTDDVVSFNTTYCFHADAKNHLIKNERKDLVSALKPSNKRCVHKSKIRIYKWKDIRALMTKPIVDRKSTRLFRMEAASRFLGRTGNHLRALVDREWIVAYKSPSHHPTDHRLLQFTVTDLQRLKILLNDYSDIMPIRAVSKYLGYDRSHVRKQFIQSEYLPVAVVPEFPREIFCYKKQVYALKRLLKSTLSGPELAGHLGVTRNTVYKWMKQGKLKPIITPGQLGFGCYRYSVASIHSLSAKH